MIDYYTSKALGGNTRKISIMLAETELPHVVHFIDLKKNVQREPWYLEISPNGLIPAIVDHDVAGRHALAESGAILIYLAEKVGRFLPTTEPGRSRTLQWVFWQVGGIGPTFGRLAHFANDVPERIDFVIRELWEQSLKLMAVLDAQLAKHEFVAGDYSIADMVLLPWIKPGYKGLTSANPSLAEGWTHVARWLDAVGARPAVALAMSRYEGSAVRVGTDAEVLE
jgi:glutathione S-transferase